MGAVGVRHERRVLFRGTRSVGMRKKPSAGSLQQEGASDSFSPTSSADISNGGTPAQGQEREKTNGATQARRWCAQEERVKEEGKVGESFPR
jgi:hypothetical protein